MFAFFGLGTQEILILAILGVLVVGVPLVIILMVSRSSGASSDRQALEEENRRLKAELERDRRPGS